MPSSSTFFRYAPQGVASLALLTGALLYFSPPVPLAAPVSKAAALVSITIGLWASGLFSEALTSLVFFAAAILFQVASPEVVLSGLGSSAFWMIFSGLVIGLAIKNSGLGAHIAGALARVLGKGQATALAGATAFGLCLAFVMPSAMGRIVLIVPIMHELAIRLGYGTGGKTARGIVLGGILGTSLPSTAIFPSNIPNNVLAGIFEHLFHRQTSYSDYLLQHFPVLGLLKTVLLMALLIHFHRDETRPADSGPAEAPKPFSNAERRLAVILFLAFAFWASDGLHHVPPAWIGLVAAIFCLVPGIGVLGPKSLQNINPEPLLYVSGVVGMGALISESGLSRELAAGLVGWLSELGADGFGNFMALCGMSTIVGVLTTLPGVPAVLTPLTGDFSTASGLAESMVLASQVAGFSTLLFPYQAPPLVTALQLTGFSRWEMTRICMIVAAASVAVLWPLDYWWLRLIQ